MKKDMDKENEEGREELEKDASNENSEEVGADACAENNEETKKDIDTEKNEEVETEDSVVDVRDMEMKVKVENIVSSITLGLEIDLAKFAESVEGIENPKRFPGVIYRITDPKLAMLIFRTGKAICSGARSREDIGRAVEQLKAKLAEGGIIVESEPLVEVQNIVASTALNFKVNLDVLATDCEDTEYEPEQFPGLIYRLKDPKTVMLIFRSGKVIITGAKTPEAANISARKTKKMVLDVGAIIEQ